MRLNLRPERLLAILLIGHRKLQCGSCIAELGGMELYGKSGACKCMGVSSLGRFWTGLASTDIRRSV